jgi:uncharacterized protein (DUF58 family)
MALTGRAAIAAAAGALLILAFRNPAMLIVVNLVLVAAIAVDVALAAPVRAVRLSRSGDTRVLLGERASVVLELTNPARRALRAVVRDAWQPSAGATPPHARLTVPAGSRATLTTQLRPDRRGDKAAAAVTIRSLGPLGLAARQGRRSAPWTVRVLPPFHSRRHLPEKLSRLRQLDGQHRALLRGQGSEFDSLREYVIGDDVRSIDWRATARLRDVMVHTWRPERDRQLLIMLDTGRTSAGRVGGIPRLDAAMDAALLLTALASRAGDRVDMLAFDRRVRARVVGVPRSAVLSAHHRAASLPDRAAHRPEPGRGDRRAAAPAAVAGGQARGARRRGGGSRTRGDVRGPERCRRGLRRGRGAAGAGRAQRRLHALATARRARGGRPARAAARRARRRLPGPQGRRPALTALRTRVCRPG